MNTTTNKATSLQAEILCLNTLYAHSKEIINHENAFLAQYVGKKLFKNDGSYLAKIPYQRLHIEKKQITAFGFTWWIDTHYWHSVKYNRYEITVKTCVSGGGADKNGVSHQCNYQQQTFGLFSINDEGTLTGQLEQDREYLNRVYNEAEILAAAKEVEQAAKVYDSVLNKVPYLFRSTLYLQRLTS